MHRRSLTHPLCLRHLPAGGLLAALCVACAALSASALPVTCGSTIKLQHSSTKFRLHSHDVAYGRGSQQQSVTTFPTGDDGNSLWGVQVREPLEHTSTRASSPP